MAIAPIASASEEAPLRARIAQGDRQGALRAVLDLFGAELGEFCMALLGNQGAAVATVDATVVQWFEQMSELGGRPVRPWLFGHALHRCRTVGLGATTPPQREPTLAYARANLRERAQQTRAWLATLRKDQREVALLRYIGRLHYAEIGAICDITPEQARKQVGRAILNLRQERILVETEETHSLPPTGRTG